MCRDQSMDTPCLYQCPLQWISRLVEVCMSVTTCRYQVFSLNPSSPVACPEGLARPASHRQSQNASLVLSPQNPQMLPGPVHLWDRYWPHPLSACWESDRESVRVERVLVLVTRMKLLRIQYYYLFWCFCFFGYYSNLISKFV